MKHPYENRSRLDEEAIATPEGETGPGVVAWCGGLRDACVCGHARCRHGERGGGAFDGSGACGFLGCECQAYRFVFSAPPTGAPTTKGDEP